MLPVLFVLSHITINMKEYTLVMIMQRIHIKSKDGNLYTLIKIQKGFDVQLNIYPFMQLRAYCPELQVLFCPCHFIHRLQRPRLALDKTLHTFVLIQSCLEFSPVNALLRWIFINDQLIW